MRLVKYILVGLTCCGCDGARENDPAVASSQTRMLDALQNVKKQDAYQKLYFGPESIEEDRQRLEQTPEALLNSRLSQLQRVGQRYLWLGQTKAAIEYFEAARALAEEYDEPVASRVEILFKLAVSYLRLGENQNCVDCNNAESCLLPIRSSGVHDQQEGSRAAIKHLTSLLRLAPDHLRAKWLLNLAYMTIGDYPEGVPKELRIAPEKFDGSEAFPIFPNVAGELGLNTRSLSGGSVVDDFDGDGDVDVIVSSWGAGDLLTFFRNDGGRFRTESEIAGFSGIFGGLNLVHADYDNDHDLDVLVLRGAWMGESGRIPNSLLQNDGSGRFTDVTFECGLAETHHPTQTAAWADIDLDGDLDLFVGNENEPCELFLNDGAGHFVDVATRAGVTNGNFTKGVSFGDFNNDRFPDLYVSNQGQANRLYRNNKDGTFTDIAQPLGVDSPNMSFATWFWDFNQDGILDIFVGSYSYGPNFVSEQYFDQPSTAERDCLFQGDGNGGFTNVANIVGLTQATQPMGANFGDLDNDGFPDFYLGTGYPDYDALMPNLMYWNRSGRAFLDVTMAGRFGHLQKGHGISFADIDSGRVSRCVLMFQYVLPVSLRCQLTVVE